MWLRNYTNVLCATFGRMSNDDNVVGLAQYADSNLTTKNTAGGIYKISCGYNTLNSALKVDGSLLISYTTQKAMASLSLILGNGTTDVTYEDYKLSSIITTGLTLVSALPLVYNTYKSANNSYVFKRTFSIQNTSRSNITISEVGLSINASNVGSTAITSLIYREVIIPIVLEPNDIILITIEQEMPLYNYQPYPV